MPSRTFFIPCVLVMFLLLTISCSGSNRDTGNTILPAVPNTLSDRAIQKYESNHYLWAYNLIHVNPGENEFELIPVKHVADHWNILGFLEQGPCTNCLKITRMELSGYGTVLIDIEITHPFENPVLTGFDVRGIAMFDGSYEFPVSQLIMSDPELGEGALVNADGFTTLYNPYTIDNGFEGYIEGNLATSIIPSSTLNAYKHFITDDPTNYRNAFYAGDTITVTYDIDMPDDEFIFGYAVDASWVPPTEKPVDDPMGDFPMSANCPEAWKIEVENLGPGLIIDGGRTRLQIDIIDWQGYDDFYPVKIECPDLFNGERNANLSKIRPGYTRYLVDIYNNKLPPPGTYPCLISVEARENDPVGKPWLDITAYQVFDVEVEWYPGTPVDVTPPWLNFCPEDICVDGNYAYIAGDVNGMHIFDISDPANPVWINRVESTVAFNNIAVFGEYAYVTYEDSEEEISGLSIIDIDPPESAYFVNTIDFPVDLSSARGIVVSGEYAYITNGTYGLQIIDVDPPESAYIVNTIDTPGSSTGVAVSGGYAYISDGNDGFRVIDIDPPESAHIVCEIDEPLDPDYQVFDVAVSGQYAYFTTNYSELKIVDIDTPESAHIIKTVDTLDPSGNVAVAGGYAYITGTGLEIIDVDPPESAHFVNTVNSPDFTYRIDVSEGFAYTVTNSTFKVFDIQPPESANIVRTVYTPCSASKVIYSDGLVYVSGTTRGFQVLDVDPIESISVIKSVTTAYSTMGLVLSGGYAFQGFWNDYFDTGFIIIDIDPLESAYVVSSYELGFWGPGTLEVSDGYAYYGTSQGAGIVDIDPPESPESVGWITTEFTRTITVSGGLAYLSACCPYEVCFEIYDIDPPESTYLVKSLPVNSGGSAITVSGGYAYKGADWLHGGLEIFDVDPIESAYLVKSASTPDTIKSIAITEGFAYVTDGMIQIINIDPPESAHLVNSVETPGSARSIVIFENYAYVGCGKAGLRIYQLW